MKKINENQTGKRTIKEVIKDNKRRIVIGVSAITIGTLSYIAFKNKLDVINEGVIVIDKETVNEGALKEAIMTINRQINYRIDRIDCMNNRGLDKLSKVSKEKYEGELKDLMIKLESFTKEYNSIILD